MSFTFFNSVETRESVDDIPLIEKKLFNSEMLRFSVDSIQADEKYKVILFHYIERSKTENQYAIAAANAITILNAAGIPFSGMDFRGIKIPGANLTGAILDHTDLREADLTEVIFYLAWLRGANLSGADMKGVQFGEKPFLKIEEPVSKLAYSPDGQWLAIGTDKGEIHLYDGKTHHWIKTLIGHEKKILSLKFSADSILLASGSELASIRVWDMKKQELSGVFKIQSETNEGVLDLGFSHNHELLISHEKHSSIFQIWDLQKQILLHSIIRYNDFYIMSALPKDLSPYRNSYIFVYSKSGRKFYGIRENIDSRDFDIRDFDQFEQRLVQMGWNHQNVKLSLSDRQIISLYTLGQGYFFEIKQSSYSTLCAMDVCPNTDLFAVSRVFDFLSHSSKVIEWWDMKSAKLVEEWIDSSEKNKNLLHFSSDGRFLAIASDSDIYLWDVATKKLFYRFQAENISGLAFSADNQYLAASSAKKIMLWEVQQHSLSQVLVGHSKTISTIDFHPNGKLLCSYSADSVRIWDLEFLLSPKRGVQINKNIMITSVDDMASNPKKTAFGAIGDGTITIFNRDLKIIYFFTYRDSDYTEYQNSCKKIALSSSLLAVGEKKTFVRAKAGIPLRIYLLDLGAREFYAELVADVSNIDTKGIGILALSFNPDETLLASGDAKGVIKLWDTKKKALQQMLILSTVTKTGTVYLLKFNSDGSVLASVYSSDNAIHLWKIPQGKMLKALEQHTDSVAALEFSPDGKWLASASLDHTICLWDVKKQQLAHTFNPRSIKIVLSDDIILSLSFDPESQLLACGSAAFIYLIDVIRKVFLHLIAPHNRSFVSFGQGGELFTASKNGAIRKWEKHSTWDGEQWVLTKKNISFFYTNRCQIENIKSIDEDSRAVLTQSISPIVLC